MEWLPRAGGGDPQLLGYVPNDRQPVPTCTSAPDPQCQGRILGMPPVLLPFETLSVLDTLASFPAAPAALTSSRCLPPTLEPGGVHMLPPTSSPDPARVTTVLGTGPPPPAPPHNRVLHPHCLLVPPARRCCHFCHFQENSPWLHTLPQLLGCFSLSQNSQRDWSRRHPALPLLNLLSRACCPEIPRARWPRCPNGADAQLLSARFVFSRFPACTGLLILGPSLHPPASVAHPSPPPSQPLKTGAAPGCPPPPSLWR